MRLQIAGDDMTERMQINNCRTKHVRIQTAFC